jgi:hypothetical protein
MSQKNMNKTMSKKKEKMKYDKNKNQFNKMRKNNKILSKKSENEWEKNFDRRQ